MDAFKIDLAKLQAHYDKIVGDGKKRIDELRKQGRTDEEIYSTVLQEGNAKIEEEAKNLFPISEKGKQLEGSLYAWKLDPRTTEHCASCIKNSKKAPMTFGKWADFGLPGVGKKTTCDNLCRCTLVVANISER